MNKKAMIGLAVLALTAVGVGTASAANPASFFHYAPIAQPYTASTATRSVSFVARIPRSVFATGDAQIDVTNISFGTAFNMEMLVACTNNTSNSGAKNGSWPLSSADDFTLTCPIFQSVVAVQGGLGITN